MESKVNLSLYKRIEQIKWRYLVSRKVESVLFQSFTENCYKYFEETTGIEGWRARNRIRLGSGELFHDQRELEELQKIFRKSCIKLFRAFKKRLINYLSSYNELATKIGKKDFSCYTRKELFREYQNFMHHCLKAHNFLLPMPVADRVLSSMILERLSEATAEQKQEWLATLTYPDKENSHVQEERSFLSLVKSYGKPNFEGLLKKHLRKFSWIGARGYRWNNEWTKKNILDRIKNFRLQNKDPKKELQHLENIRKERKKEAIKLISKLGIKKDKKLYNLIRIAKEFAYLRTWRTDILYRAGYKVRNMFYEIAKRAKIKEKDIIYFSYLEVEEIVQTGKSPLSADEFKKRKESGTHVVLENLFIILNGKENEKKISELIVTKPESVEQIKGQVAFKGKVSGKVKIVLSNQDIRKVKQRDILVAVMTFPNFVPAMEKASGFVTDEGGILCHAAIIAREMRKPCIIGTKIATKVLKDGDMVEVDANKGIVKKLKS